MNLMFCGDTFSSTGDYSCLLRAEKMANTIIQANGQSKALIGWGVSLSGIGINGSRNDLGIYESRI